MLVNLRHFNANIIEDIKVPKSVELVWVKVIPKFNCPVNVFVVCGLYSKPNSKTKTVTNDHIAENFHYLKSKYTSIKFFIIGDFNDLRPDIILQQSPQLRQLVHHKTCGESIIDLIISDCHNLYHPPFSTQPLQPDDPEKAKESDHLVNLFLPRTDSSISSRRTFNLIKIRPITASQINAIGNLLIKQDR